MAIVTEALHSLIDPDIQRAIKKKLTLLEFTVWSSIVSLNLAGRFNISSRYLANHANISGQSMVGALMSLERKMCVKRAKAGGGRFTAQVIVAQHPPVAIDRHAAIGLSQDVHEVFLANAYAQLGAKVDTKTGEINWDCPELQERLAEVQKHTAEVQKAQHSAKQTIEAQHSAATNVVLSPEDLMAECDLHSKESFLPSEETKNLVHKGDSNNHRVAHANTSDCSQEEQLTSPPGTTDESTMPVVALTPRNKGGRRPEDPVKAAARKKPAKRPSQNGDMALIQMSKDAKRELVLSKSKAQGVQIKKRRLLQLLAGRIKDKYIKARRDATGAPWYANGVWDPSFIKVASLMIEYQIKFDDFLDYCVTEYAKFVKGVEYPTPRMLHAREMCERFSMFDPSKVNGSRFEIQGGISYKEFEKYDMDSMELLVAAGLPVPPDDPPHLRGMALDNIMFFVDAIPASGDLDEAYGSHICVIASREKPDKLKAWAQKRGVQATWSKVVAMARTHIGTEREALWEPIIRIHDEISGVN